MKHYFLYIISSLLFASCQTQLDPTDYVRWVQNPSNGLVQVEVKEPYTFQAQYEPADYVLLRKYQGKLPQQDMEKQELKEMEGYRFYTLSISLPNGNLTKSATEAEYIKKVDYYTFDFKKDIYLEAGGLKYPCSQFYFDNMYNQLGPNARFLLGFNTKNEVHGDQTLCIDSKVMGSGVVRLKIMEKDIQQTPQLKHG